MCGIVGCIGKLTLKEEAAFADLLVMNAVRGFDSVGVAAVAVEAEPTIIKGTMFPQELIKTEEYRKEMYKSHRCLIGHNRAATIGTVVPENAHPFRHGHITGVHNGTLNYRGDLVDNNKFSVDSDNLYYHLSEKGAEDMYANLHGAAALAWWDKDNQTFNMLRNKERPLWMRMNDAGTVLYFASEYEMLHAALARNGLAKSTDKYFTVKVDTLYSVHVPYTPINQAPPKLEIVETSLTPAKPRPIERGWASRYTYHESDWDWDGYYLRKKEKIEDGRPDWLATDQKLLVVFDSRLPVTSGEKVVYSGYSVLDDRVNVTYTRYCTYKDGLENDGPLIADEQTVYEIKASSIESRTYRGAKEWQVTGYLPTLHSTLDEWRESQMLDEEEPIVPWDGMTLAQLRILLDNSVSLYSTLYHGTHDKCMCCGKSYVAREEITVINTTVSACKACVEDAKKIA